MNSKPIIIAVDAMGGDNSPLKVITGIKISLSNNKNNFFLLYGNEKILKSYIEKDSLLNKYCKIIHTEEQILGSESPLEAAKKKNKSSMWSAIEAQDKEGADITLSAGNTGALLVISRIILRTLENVEKPALAALWPNKVGMNIVLDLGASVECNEKNLVDFCNMGSALYNSLYPETDIKVALLNIGSEEIKGKEYIKKAYVKLKSLKEKNYEFSGYIEPNNMMNGNVHVIVTDGFTGNVALKTAEGTADFITKSLKQQLTSSLLSKLSMIFAHNSLKRFKDKLDPRKYNGAIFLGLNGPVVKSHGGTDSLGFSHSIKVCNKIVTNNLMKKIKQSLKSVD